MQISSIGANTAFRAKVESPNPLISGDWHFISETPAAATPEEPKKKSHWFRNTLIAIAAVAVATAALVGLGKTDAISKVMKSGKKFGDQKGFGNKTKYVIGQICKAANWLKDNTWGKIAGLFKGDKAEKITEGVAEAGKKTNKKTTGKAAEGVAEAGKKISKKAAAEGTAEAGKKVSKKTAAEAGKKAGKKAAKKAAEGAADANKKAGKKAAAEASKKADKKGTQKAAKK